MTNFLAKIAVIVIITTIISILFYFVCLSRLQHKSTLPSKCLFILNLLNKLSIYVYYQIISFYSLENKNGLTSFMELKFDLQSSSLKSSLNSFQSTRKDEVKSLSNLKTFKSKSSLPTSTCYSINTR